MTERRAELAGEIILAKKRLAEMKTDLDHLDATLRQFDPDAVLGAAYEEAGCYGA